jgi:hypothetical protein
MKKFLCVLAFCGMLSCQPKPAPAHRSYTNTEYFAALLQKAFNKKIDSSQHFYLLVTDGCHGCSGTSSKFFHSLITKDSSLPITIIISKLYNLPEEIRHDRIVWLDTTSTVDRCPLLAGNVCLVEVHNGAVDSVRNFEITDVQEIWRYVHFTKKLPY